MPRGLYLHVPFCHAKCHYCDFVITTNRSEDSRKRFLSVLAKEIRRAREQYGRLAFDTLYLGGGTPSVLLADEMMQVIESLKKAFELRSGSEFTSEMNPEDANPEKLRAYRDLGINRISLGAQSFNDELLKGMGRHHTAQDTVRAVRRLKDAGFQNISLDLMIKLPGQTLSDVEHSLEQAIALKPSQVSVYDLDLHDQTVFGSLAQKGQLNLPSEEEHMEMFDGVSSRLGEAGFVQYELSNFAKPGFESKHNLIYWHNQEYLGLGPGAFSYLSGVRYQFALSVERYFQKCALNDWTRDVEDRITNEKKEIETLLTGLRLREGIDLRQFQIIRKSIEQKVSGSELFEKRGERVALSRRGRFLAENAFSFLISND